jgi:hypothetical protein
VLVPVVAPVVVPASFSFEDGPPLPPQAIQSEPIRIGAAIHANGRRTRFKGEPPFQSRASPLEGRVRHQRSSFHGFGVTCRESVSQGRVSIATPRKRLSGQERTTTGLNPPERLNCERDSPPEK